MTSPNTDELDRTYRITRFVCIAFAASTGVYVFLAELLGAASEPSGAVRVDRFATSYLKYVFLIVSCAEVALIRLLMPYFLLAKGKARGIPLPAPVVLNRLHGVYTAAFALCNTPAILGLIYVVLGGERTIFYVLAGISWAGFLLSWPRKNEWAGILSP